ncbi:hypothetical protein EUGRSUZ_C00302 [Eucalyptus grandis]|uniref:Uncharacterized protein n=3 Tax=Eucalyptus grandis TaxID=71139 RepID=A0A059CK90_EUCGR|nr:hypothetical protein EUGRSUZ_C00302 [Eucalyptus grandis]KAK3435871.1 hypothetical protein EUGRSUZ_C00302 [Eucalyptus grandis]
MVCANSFLSRTPDRRRRGRVAVWRRVQVGQSSNVVRSLSLQCSNLVHIPTPDMPCTIQLEDRYFMWSFLGHTDGVGALSFFHFLLGRQPMRFPSALKGRMDEKNN